MNYSERLNIDCTNRKLKILNSPTDIKICGKAYYVSSNGNDDNSGGVNDPWKSIDKVNSVHFQEGDGVFLKRGDVFRGHLRLQNGVTYSAYGEGNKPCIYGSPEGGNVIENWEKASFGEKIWKYKIPLTDVGTIVFDGGEIFAEKVYANCKEGIFYPYGAISEGKFEIETALDRDLKFFCECKGNNEENGLPTRKTTGYLYLRSDRGNPAQVFKEIEFNVLTNVLEGAYCENTTIDNLCVKYGGSHGIGAGHVKNFKVQNCEIGWIGGSVMCYSSTGQPTRYGNAVEVYGSCDGYVVTNCYIYQCYDTGITHQQGGGGCNYYMDNIHYMGNLIEDCYWNIEYFLDKATDPQYTVRLMRNVLIENNILRRAGYGFGTLRPNTKCAANIMGWWKEADGENIVFKNNVFDRSVDFLINASTCNPKAVPKLQGNIYIQTDGRYFGRMGANLPKPERENSNYMDSMKVFTHGIEDYIKNILGDKSAKIYIL